MVLESGRPLNKAVSVLGDAPLPSKMAPSSAAAPIQPGIDETAGLGRASGGGEDSDVGYVVSTEVEEVSCKPLMFDTCVNVFTGLQPSYRNCTSNIFGEFRWHRFPLKCGREHQGCN